MRFDVAVVGGGISGLAAAHHLHRSGHAVVLIETTSRLGGKVQTDHHDGFMIEAGPDSFVTGKRSVLDLARDLGLEESVISSRPEHRGSHIWWRGRLHPLPGGLLLMVPSRLGPLLGSSLLSWRGKLRVLADLVIPRGEKTDESLESFVDRRLGREVLERIAEPLIAGIHAADPSTMSLRASFPRFLEMEREHRSLILAARAAAFRPTANGLSHFASFDGGMGQLTDALAGSIAGADIRTSTTVTALEGGDDGYRLALNNRSELKADGVVLATPARTTAQLLSGIAPEAAAAVADIQQVATSTVTLAYRTEHIPSLPGSGFVVPAVEDRRIMGVSYLSQKWSGRVPDSRFVLLRAFVGGSKGQELARAEQDQLESAVRHELDAMVGITADPVRSWARSWDDGLHQYTLGHRDRVVRAESALATHPGLALAGAAFHGIGLNECVDSGRSAAETVLAARSGSARSRPTVRLRSPGVPINATQQLRPQRTAPDRFMRRLLRVGDLVDKNAIFGARRSTTTAIVISGIRCMITYLLIPSLAPIVGLLDTFSVPVTVALSVLAIVMGISGLRRFWIADHRARWSYTVFIGVVLVLLSVGIVFDLSTFLPV